MHNSNSDGFNDLQQFWDLNPNKLIIAHININSGRNNFDLLKDQIKVNVNILMILETKFDDCFRASQFEINDLNKPFGVDRNEKGVAIILYIREDIPAKPLSVDKLIKSCFVKLNLKFTNWLINYLYNAGPFWRFSTCAWQNACVNSVRSAMVCDVYISLSKIERIYIIFLKKL